MAPRAGRGRPAAQTPAARRPGPPGHRGKSGDLAQRRGEPAPRAKPPALGRQALAARAAAVGDDLAAADRGHARPEAMPTLTNQLAGLISAFHNATPSNTSPRALPPGA